MWNVKVLRFNMTTSSIVAFEDEMGEMLNNNWCVQGGPLLVGNYVTVVLTKYEVKT